MITVYEIKKNGYLGASKQIDPREGVASNWSYTAPPGAGPHRWVSGQWESCTTEPEVAQTLINIDAIAQGVREQRDVLLAACDWTQTLDAPVDREAWATYRQILREVPEQAGFPLRVDWPAKPKAGV